MTRLLLAALAALTASACTTGYEYAYDPYLGVRGHHTGPFSRPAAAPACQRVEYRGPYYDGYRGPYYAGPYCVQDAAVDASAQVAR